MDVYGRMFVLTEMLMTGRLDFTRQSEYESPKPKNQQDLFIDIFHRIKDEEEPRMFKRSALKISQEDEQLLDNSNEMEWVYIDTIVASSTACELRWRDEE